MKLGQGNVFTGVCDSVHRGSVCSGGSAPGECLLWGLSAPGGCLLLGDVCCQGGVCSRGVPVRGGGCLVVTPRRDGHCCGRYAFTGMHFCEKDFLFLRHFYFVALAVNMIKYRTQHNMIRAQTKTVLQLDLWEDPDVITFLQCSK